MGIAVAIMYVTIGRRRVDYRFVLLGAVLPDIVDGLLHVFGVFDGPAGRWIAHSLLSAIVIAVVILVAFKGERRLSIFGIFVGWLLHQVGDGMWSAPETFFWPAFGTNFSTTPAEPYSWDLLSHPFDHLGTWGGEVAGLLILWWFYVAFRLGQEKRLSLFLKDGYLRP
jgi:inner membrane protein